MNSFQESQVIWKHKFAFDTRLHNETRALTVYDRMILDTGLPGRGNGAILSNEKPIYPVNPVFDVLKKHGVGLVFSHWTWLPPLRKQLAKAGTEFFNSGKQAVIRLITPLRMSYEESYAKAFPFDKMVPGMLDPEMIEDTAKIVNEGQKDKVQVNLIINNRAGGNAPLIAEKIADRLHKERQQGLF